MSLSPTIQEPSLDIASSPGINDRGLNRITYSWSLAPTRHHILLPNNSSLHLQVEFTPRKKSISAALPCLLPSATIRLSSVWVSIEEFVFSSLQCLRVFFLHIEARDRSYWSLVFLNGRKSFADLSFTSFINPLLRNLIFRPKVAHKNWGQKLFSGLNPHYNHVP